MKIVWICNIQFPKVSKLLGEEINNFGGWLVNSAEALARQENVELCILYPKNKINKTQEFNIDGIKFIAFPKFKMEEHIRSILKSINPDIIHIHGTEEKHSLATVRANDMNIDMVLNIQGLVSMIGKYYRSEIPKNIVYKHKLRDILKNSSIIYQEKDFNRRGKIETEVIKNVKYVIGRTEWDNAYINSINDKAKYFKCNETLRKSFYNNKWDLEKCEKYTIFMSQGSYPIKGLHHVIEVMPTILKRYPKAQLRIAGPNIIDKNNLKSRLKENSYGNYIRKLINKYNLWDNITFLGNLSEKEMCLNYLKSHVYICPSIIENSPNSLGEAMMLGMPCIASYTGGIPSLVTHGCEGFLYPVNHEYMLAYYIEKLFSDDKIAIEISKNAHNKAKIIHDEEINTQRMLEIYNYIIDNKDKI